MEEKQFRNKITFFTFFYSILVIWVHSYNAVLFLGDTPLSFRMDRVERFWGNVAVQIAVPGFFLISSYLFFRGFSLEMLAVKWKSRLRSVLLPYVVWNFLYYLGYAAGSRIPVLSDVIGKGEIPLTLLEMGKAILFHSYNYVFWYLQQLILLILLAPVIYVFIKERCAAGLFLMGILTALYVGVSLPLLNLDALFYYSVGAFAAVHGKKAVESSWNRKRCGLGAVILLSAFLMKAGSFPASIQGEILRSVVGVRLLFPLGLWLIVPESRLAEGKEWMKQNFLLYAVHFALVRLMNKTGAFLFFGNPFLPLALFLFLPVFCVILSYEMSRFLRRFLPGLWFLLNGGR